MRTIKLVGALILLFSNSSQAIWGESSYGFLGGMSSFKQDLANDNSGITRDHLRGLYLGAFSENYLSPSWVLSPGVFVSQKGVQNSGSLTRATYLETSAQLRWYFTDQPNWRSYFGFGAAFGILIDAESVTNNGESTNSFDLMNKNELSGQLGAGFEFPVSSETGLQIGCQYVHGLTDNLAAGSLDGKWSGIYAFVALRFKSARDSERPVDRAMEYLKWKNQELSPVNPRTVEIEKSVETAEINQASENPREPQAVLESPVEKPQVYDEMLDTQKSDWE